MLTTPENVSPLSPDRPGRSQPSHWGGRAAAWAVTAWLLLIAAAAGAAPAPQGDLDGWRQIFVEDFDHAVPTGSFPGSHYRSRWGVYPDGWWDTTRRGRQMPSRVLSVEDGSLTWRFHENEQGVPMLANPQPKLNGANAFVGITYGRFAVRFRATELAKGYSMVFLLWPDSERWPLDGEINFPAGELTAEQRVHYSFIPAQHDLLRTGGGSNLGLTTWRTAVTEWTPDAVRFYLDGQLIGTASQNVPRTPMHWVLQTDTTEFGAPPAPGARARLEVDWAAAWAYAPGTAAGPPALPNPAPGAPNPPPTGGERRAPAANGPLCLAGFLRRSGTVAAPCRRLRVRAGACLVRRPVTVGRALAVTLPARAGRPVVTVGGRRAAAAGRVDLRRHVGRTVRLWTAFDRAGKRQRACTVLRVVNR